MSDDCYFCKKPLGSTYTYYWGHCCHSACVPPSREDKAIARLERELVTRDEAYIRAWNERDAQRRRAEAAEARIATLECDVKEMRERVHYAEGTADANIQRAEAAERKVAELERENAELRAAGELLAKLGKKIADQRDEAEADKARLSEALREVRLAITNADPAVLTDTFWMPDDVFRGGTVVDFIDAALSGSGSGWRAMEGWKLVPVEPTEAMVDATPVFSRCGRDWRLDAVATYRAMLSAAPQQGRE